MVSGFTTKKIKKVSSLGEMLKSARQKRKASLLDVESATKIRAKFVAALENGNWEFLPQRVYTRSFVLAYARYLGLKTSEIMPLFESESDLFAITESKNLSYHRSIREFRWVVTPKLLGYIVVGVVSVFMFSYIFYQVAGFAGSPTLQVAEPKDNSIIDQEDLALSGLTDTDSVVTVNDEKIPVTSEGKFALEMKLHRGVNVISVRAINKAKKESSQTFTVEYRPQTAVLTTTELNQ